MSAIQPNTSMYTTQTGTPLYTYGNNSTAVQQPSVAVSTPQTSQVYQYPQTSLYNDPSKQAASGVNIYIYNPSAFGAPSSTSTANATYTLPQQQTAPSETAAPAAAPIVNQPQANAIANTPISTNEETKTNNYQKTKRIVELTDDYIKSLESYLRSPDETIRKTGIKQLIKRYEEDSSRYDDPALTALLNIALQDPSVENRMLVMSPIASGAAHGDNNTIEILNNLTSSDKMYGQEAVMANNALIKAAETDHQIVPDYSPDRTTRK